ncbi:hypothetical protein [Pseudoxanthomonas beigongshangi]
MTGRRDAKTPLDERRFLFRERFRALSLSLSYGEGRNPFFRGGEPA